MLQSWDLRGVVSYRHSPGGVRLALGMMRVISLDLDLLDFWGMSRSRFMCASDEKSVLNDLVECDM